MNTPLRLPLKKIHRVLSLARVAFRWLRDATTPIAWFWQRYWFGDPLTGLLNRARFCDRITQSIRRSQRLNNCSFYSSLSYSTT